MGNSSYINVIAFVIITILYYSLKPTLTLKHDEAQKYKETRYVYLSIYLMIIILTQFFVNVSIIKSTCGGNITANIGPAALFTFMPWLFIFGIMVVILLLYPGFKSVFADVIGYFYISSAANEIITTLLINKEVEDAMDKGGEPSFNTTDASAPPPPYSKPDTTNYITSDITPSAPPESAISTTPTQESIPIVLAEPIQPGALINSIPEGSTPGKVVDTLQLPPTSGGRKTVIKRREQIKKGGGKKEMQDAAEIIVKICGNMSVLINQITPENFDGYWKILTPLMKPKYQNENNTVETEKLKNDLFQLVVTRDNVGESMWYIYAGILVTSIVQLKIATRGCVKSTAQMEKDYQSFLDEEAVAKANKDKLEETTYTL